MENFITGYPGNGVAAAPALRGVARRRRRTTRFFDRFLDGLLRPTRTPRSSPTLGLNCVRIPFNYRHFEDDDAPFELSEEGFRAARPRHRRLRPPRHLHDPRPARACPGAQNQHWHSDNPTHMGAFWSTGTSRTASCTCGRRSPTATADNPWVAGYNLINEPADADGRRRSARSTSGSRRRSARSTPTTSCSSTATGTRPSSIELGEPMPNTVYTAHDYALPGFVDGGAVPGRDARRVRRPRPASRRRSSRAPSTCATPARRSGSASSARSTPATRSATSSATSCSPTSSRSTSGTTRAGRSGPTRTSACRGSVTRRSRLRVPAPHRARPREEGAPGRGLVGLDRRGRPRTSSSPSRQLFAREFPDFEPYPWGAPRWIARARAPRHARRGDGRTTSRGPSPASDPTRRRVSPMRSPSRTASSENRSRRSCASLPASLRDDRTGDGMPDSNA